MKKGLLDAATRAGPLKRQKSVMSDSRRKEDEKNARERIPENQHVL